ncbi:MAG: Do family serine endopeptidase [Verrucomicrobiales bacterium]|jgi:serine protease Do|nr:Do family serine endopeptidase [Verrucomicrobiales bacterium]
MNKKLALAALLGIWSLDLGTAPASAQDWWPFGKKRAEVTVSAAPVTRRAELTTSYAPVVKLIAPSVVTIRARRSVRADDARQPFADADAPPARESGSGVIVSADGYILTNNHVVAGQDRITVILPTDGAEHEARLIGADAKSDVAVLKINARDLPAATLGDSDQLEVGDVVLAIGNPFDLGQTVTMGIVSGLGRKNLRILERGAYANFIQTDAAINSGNSGGALVDVEGRVIGINTAIISASGGNLGIGFAIPVNMARFIMEQLIAHGKVTRGYLGVHIDNLDADLAASYGRRSNQGVLIQSVETGSPAARAGLRRGDIITAVNDEPATDAHTLRLAVSSLAPNTALVINYLRDGAEHSASVTLARLPDHATAGGGAPMPDRAADAGRAGATIKALGLDIQPLTADLRRELNLRDTVSGVVIARVDPNSAAADKGLRRGTVILEINDQPVAAVKEVIEAVRQSRLVVRLYLSDDGITRYVALKKSGE